MVGLVLVVLVVVGLGLVGLGEEVGLVEGSRCRIRFCWTSTTKLKAVSLHFQSEVRICCLKLCVCSEALQRYLQLSLICSSVLSALCPHTPPEITSGLSSAAVPLSQDREDLPSGVTLSGRQKVAKVQMSTFSECLLYCVKVKDSHL